MESAIRSETSAFQLPQYIKGDIVGMIILHALSESPLEGDTHKK